MPRLSVSRIVYGTQDVVIPSGSSNAKIVVETPFAPMGAVASPSGATPGYTVSTQEFDGVEEIVVFRSGSTASPVTRSVSYVEWG